MFGCLYMKKTINIAYLTDLTSCKMFYIDIIIRCLPFHTRTGVRTHFDRFLKCTETFESVFLPGYENYSAPFYPHLKEI